MKPMRGLWAGLCLGLSGCGVTGTWSLATVDPIAATRDVEFHTLRMEQDGSFYAESKEEREGGIASTSGVYTFDDGVLHLKEHDGERHTYDARLENSAQELCLERTWNGRKLKMKYDRRG